MRRHYVVVTLLCGLNCCKPLRHKDKNFGEGQSSSPAALAEIKLETAKNKPVSIDLRSYNKDLEASLAYVIDPGAAYGSVVADASDTALFTYTPTGDHAGDEKLSYGLLGKPPSERASLIISLVNQVPHAQDIELSVARDSEVTLALVGIDADDDAVTYEMVTEPKNGELRFDTKGGWVDYQPRAGFEGDEVMSYRAKDAHSSSEPATITLHVGSDPSKEAKISFAVIKNSKQTLQLKAESGSSNFTLVRPPKHGSLDKLDAQSGSVTYAPTTGYEGIDDFRYGVKDDKGAEQVYTVELTIVNRLPLLTSVPVYEHVINQALPKDIRLAATVRDFKASHPDFMPSTRLGEVNSGMLEDKLDGEGKPVYAGKDQYGLVASRESFGQWYRDHQDNCRSSYSIEFPFNAETKKFHYANQKFFTVDNLCFGNEGQTNNYLFTVELTTSFIYQASDTITFNSDDDFWAFINGRLVLDLGGRHGVQSKQLSLGTVGPQLGLEAGKAYELAMFYADRGPQEAKFGIETTVALRSTRIYQYQLAAHDADGEAMTYTLVKGPAGMSIDEQRGLLKWSPRLVDQGVHTVQVEVQDSSGGIGSQEFLLNVKKEL